MTDEKFLISIVIPIYNVEPYLCRCIDSILAQTFIDFECILVDDGSPDNCPAICDKYAKKDGRIIVIHQENKGTAFARDEGIKRAKGELLTFVDSDDWLEVNALDLLYNKQRETSADLVIGGMKKIYVSRIRYYLFPLKTFSRDDDVLVYYFLYPCATVWGKLYKRELFNGYSVPTTNMGEDGITNVQVFSKVKKEKLQIVDKPVYNYNRRSNGIVLKSLERCNDTLYAAYPGIACRLWAENFLKETNRSASVLEAFAYNMILQGIIPYLQATNHVNRETVSLFYRRYYRQCPYIRRIPFPLRVIIPLLYHVAPIGRVYVIALNMAIRLFKKFFGY
jgi:glycosyltransferase involved in cell wall biosynthesis